MTDDQSRPTDEQHQDAESETPKESRDASGEERPASSEVRETEVDRVSDDAETVADDPATDDAESGDLDPETAPEPTAESDDVTADSEESDVSESDALGVEAPEDDGAADDSVPDADDSEADEPSTEDAPEVDVPDDVRKYERFKKMDGAQYDRVNEFLRERTYITAREWAIARLCADFRTETGVEMTKIGKNLPELVPFMTDTYTPQAVNQARSSFEDKVRQAGATFLYGAMSGFFTAEELDDMMYEVTEVAKFLLEVEGVDLTVEEELEAEDRISGVMREVQTASEELRRDELECPNCGHEMEAADDHDHDVEADD